MAQNNMKSLDSMSLEELQNIDVPSSSKKKVANTGKAADDGGVSKKVAGAKKALDEAWNSKVSGKRPATPAKPPSVTPVSDEKAPSAGLLDEARSAGEGIKARQDQAQDLPKMHSGGEVKEDGGKNLQKGEVVLPKEKAKEGKGVLEEKKKSGPMAQAIEEEDSKKGNSPASAKPADLAAAQATPGTSTSTGGATATRNSGAATGGAVTVTISGSSSTSTSTETATETETVGSGKSGGKGGAGKGEAKGSDKKPATATGGPDTGDKRPHVYNITINSTGRSGDAAADAAADAADGEPQDKEAGVKKMHGGGDVDEDGVKNLQKGEIVLPKDKDKAEKMAIEKLGKKAKGVMSSAMDEVDEEKDEPKAEEEHETRREEKSEGHKPEKKEGKEGEKKEGKEGEKKEGKEGEKGGKSAAGKKHVGFHGYSHKGGHVVHHMYDDGSSETHNFALGDHAGVGSNIADVLGQQAPEGGGGGEGAGLEPQGAGLEPQGAGGGQGGSAPEPSEKL